jgi:hypothetical protein
VGEESGSPERPPRLRCLENGEEGLFLQEGREKASEKVVKKTWENGSENGSENGLENGVEKPMGKRHQLRTLHVG